MKGHHGSCCCVHGIASGKLSAHADLRAPKFGHVTGAHVVYALQRSTTPRGSSPRSSPTQAGTAPAAARCKPAAFAKPRCCDT